jgi:hypothetical protein
MFSFHLDDLPMIPIQLVPMRTSAIGPDARRRAAASDGEERRDGNQGT